MTVLNHMRQPGEVADQYHQGNSTSTAAISSLVGSSAHVKALNTVANETYPDTYTQGSPIIVTGIAGAGTITHVQ